jgi:hypothetical protein
VFNPFLAPVKLTSKTTLMIQGLAMKIQSFRYNRQLVSFILSPYELTLVLKFLRSFMDKIVRKFILP